MEFLKYPEVLEKLKDQDCHLLLGNGFNRGLGIDTSYQAIFKEMLKDNHGIYKDAQDYVQQSDGDLERFIGTLVEDIDDSNAFLKKYVSNKIKSDFMKATHQIVKAGIKNIYAEKNEGVFLLLKNFKNYLTLNYDSFLYLLLLNFKLENERSIVFEPNLLFVEEDMDTVANQIFSEIKKARKSGEVKIDFGDSESGNSVSQPMKYLTKKNFISEVEIYSKNQSLGWKTKEIETVVNYILEEEKKVNLLNEVDDGSEQMTLFNGENEFVFNIARKTQNLFFLHGAFHIYRDKNKEKKIIQTYDKALYGKLEGILNNEERDIVAIFQAEGKKEEIKKSNYLTKGLNKLSELSGVMVIIGCSLSNNDSHIFEAIEKSRIETLFISSRAENKEMIYQQAKDFFRTKEITLFDAESISYELPVAG